ncbi:hypothetical protein Kpol_400p9 [Vanderwaltozyma polyspora DSM 70294]|uniref:NADP-dependent oxidoreductase domain-containing protein n=1 Tax=Vanderwaltozyma polyspora (strain ATCC 22028 / DSM 70294 / BCRC 21397 / CBS 2163 / NBRC 10782 / NRRL Y-8283 / UCD 57-17) TaxID=436907 RepID=A7TRU8_VANPO|nr:uncharacterized protein Kpol_400p9 [Vanderwaltozyma polyspora DSM 70294]EDO15015.1 hypothetical protein Kpol_400p9 [Vanderwaltozyma polyspora DSM 70294]
MSLLQQKKFGNTGLKVSPIIIGCMSFGSKKWSEWVEDDREKIFKILKYAYDKGLRTYDTANVYSNGESEIILGEFLKNYKIPRETVIIMTKLYFPTNDNADYDIFSMTPEAILNNVNITGLSRKNIINSARDSVRRLGTYADIIQIHRADPDTPFEETMRALNDIVVDGLTRYIGASSMLATEFVEMQFIAEKNDWFKFINSQSCYNLLYREDERELIPFAKRHNIALTPWSPLQRGVLCRPVGETSTRFEKDQFMSIGNIKDINSSDEEIITRVEEIAKKRNTKMATVALYWVIQKGCFPIVGMSKIDRIDEAIAALEINLTKDEMTYLEEPYKPRDLIM